MVNFVFPLNLELTNPPRLPASSPEDMLMVDFLVIAFLFLILTFLEQLLPFAWVIMAIFG